MKSRNKAPGRRYSPCIYAAARLLLCSPVSRALDYIKEVHARVPFVHRMQGRKKRARGCDRIRRKVRRTDAYSTPGGLAPRPALSPRLR